MLHPLDDVIALISVIDIKKKNVKIPFFVLKNTLNFTM